MQRPDGPAARARVGCGELRRARPPASSAAAARRARVGLGDVLDRAAGGAGDRDEVGRLHELAQARVRPGDVLGHAARRAAPRRSPPALRAPLVRRRSPAAPPTSRAKAPRRPRSARRAARGRVREVPAGDGLDKPVDARPSARRRPSRSTLRGRRSMTSQRSSAPVTSRRRGRRARRRRRARRTRPRARRRTSGPSELTTRLASIVAISWRRSGCSASRWPKRSTTARREVVAQVALEERVVGQVGVEQRARDVQLGVGEQQRQLGPLEALDPRGGARRAPRRGQRLGGRGRAARLPPARSSAPRRRPSGRGRPRPRRRGSAPAGSES